MKDTISWDEFIPAESENLNTFTSTRFIIRDLINMFIGSKRTGYFPELYLRKV